VPAEAVVTDDQQSFVFVRPAAPTGSSAGR
jgi:hypothetical protein